MATIEKFEVILDKPFYKGGETLSGRLLTKCSDKLEFKLQCLPRATDTGGGNWRCQ